MFLDEPTTGLDSISAYNVINLITEEAKLNNRIIIFTIHQPNSKIFNLFDELLLMSQGKIVYHEDAKNAINYYAQMGYECPVNFNPAEFFIKILSKESKLVEKIDFKSGLTDYINKKVNSEKTGTGFVYSDKSNEKIINNDKKYYELPSEEIIKKDNLEYDELIEKFTNKVWNFYALNKRSKFMKV